MSPTESIDLLIADGIVDALIQRVKTGKEAEVFIVQKGENFFAAKVYKERTARNFKNNVAYKEGRVVKNTRDARAIAKGSKYGLSLSESDWRHMEHDALVTVIEAGVRVPKPELIYEGILIMELVLGTDGQPAPRLIEVALSKEEALAYHREMIGMIVGMLTCDLIHGDLSPYNILMAWNGPTIIDLPQAIKAAHNSQAEQFLVRDVRNVTEHFARFAPELKRRVNDGYAIWKRYMKRDLPRDYFPEEGEGQPPKEKKFYAPPPAATATGPRREVVIPRPAPPAPRPATPAPVAAQAQPQPPRTEHARPQHHAGPRPQHHSPRPQHHARPNGAPHSGTAHQNGAPHNGTAHQNGVPHNGTTHQNGVPHNGAAHQNGAPRPNGAPHQARPENGQRPPHRNNQRPNPNGGQQRRPDAPRRPNPPGPVIERVTRMGPAPTGGATGTPENRPARFSQHHRNRPG